MTTRTLLSRCQTASNRVSAVSNPSLPTRRSVTHLRDFSSPRQLLDAVLGPDCSEVHLHGLDVRVVALVADGADGTAGYVDLDGSTLAGLRRRGEAGLVLRPDFYAYGSATSAGGLRDLVASLPAALRLRAGAAARDRLATV